MDQKLDLTGFRITSVSGKVLQTAQATTLSPLELLVGFIGDWRGTGFNQIWRPARGSSDHFLELNQTIENLQFVPIHGDIPNRGFFQEDINVHGMTYLQTVNDAVVKDNEGNLAGLHVEPGIWINIPNTNDPQEVKTVARLANIPHGTSLLAQGIATEMNGPPDIAPVDITPFGVGTPDDKIKFPAETDLTSPSEFRTKSSDIPQVTQAMLDDPNSVLRDNIKGKNIKSTVVITVSTNATVNPNVGGGISNAAFLQGSVAQGPNAQAAKMDATFWIETLVDENGNESLQLQYSQLVLLNFNQLSWPHVSVATLTPINRDSAGPIV